jgi:hypothetical protein
VISDPFNLESALYECSSDGDFVSSTLELLVLSQATNQLLWKAFDLLQEVEIMRESDQFGRRAYGWRTVHLAPVCGREACAFSGPPVTREATVPRRGV